MPTFRFGKKRGTRQGDQEDSLQSHPSGSSQPSSPAANAGSTSPANQAHHRRKSELSSPDFDADEDERKLSETSWIPPDRNAPVTIVAASSSIVPTALPRSRLDLTYRTRSHSADDNLLGLTLIHEPKDLAPVDIVFVHSLGGTSEYTWSKGPDLGGFWPREYLPLEPDIQSARVLSFAYDADFEVTERSIPNDSIMNSAMSLLKSMKSPALQKLEIGKRPLVFIAHSMGGLVVKQVCIIGQNDTEFKEIVSAISAIIFLATPHRGEDLAQTLRRILTVFNSPKPYISEAMVTGPQAIKLQNDQFRHIASRSEIYSFYETRPMLVGSEELLIVEPNSATFGSAAEVVAPLDADHLNISHFESISDPNYLRIRNVLRTLVSKCCTKARGVLKSQNKVEIEQLRSLLGIAETYQEDLDFFRTRWTKGTCQWILSHPSFVEWQTGSDTTSILWLHARPGSGKSVVSSFVTDHLQQSSFLCVYHFFRFTDQSKKSLSTCLRSSAYQIAEKLPQFRTALQKLGNSTNSLHKMDHNVLWDKIFLKILFKLDISEPIFWVIDGLDESDQPQLLFEMMENLSQAKSTLKVLIVSRRTPPLITIYNHLSMHVPSAELPIKDTQADIRLFVKQKLRYLEVSEGAKRRIVNRFITTANGSFLWASLALPEILECDTEEDIDAALSAIPTGMEKMYAKMEKDLIDELPAAKQRLGKAILMWVACSRRPLTTEEMKQALQKDFSGMFNIKATVHRVCGQFVVIDSADQLIMVHQTARDHLTASKSVLSIDVADSHVRILTKCLSVLHEQKRPQHELIRAQNQAFTSYAMSSWAYHLVKTPQDSWESLGLLVDFLERDTVLVWISLLATNRQLKVLVSSSKSMSSYVQRQRTQHPSKSDPFDTRSRGLDLVDAWATDFLKILGKFGRKLNKAPDAIFDQIGPFCPKNSMIYRHFHRQNAPPYRLSVEGISRSEWDDSLARLSLGADARAMLVTCSGDHVAVMSATGNVVLYDHDTFEVKRTLRPGERGAVMCFSSCSQLIAVYGVKKTRVWSVDDEKPLYEIDNLGGRALSMTFSAGRTELLIGGSDRVIRKTRLTETSPTWSTINADLLKDTNTLGKAAQNVPWAIVFSPHANHIAVSYRGHPLSVFRLDPPTFIRKLAQNEHEWPIVQQVNWHPGTEELVGIGHGRSVFRWNPLTGAQKEHLTIASKLASSPDGKFIAAGDSHGTIRIINFESMTPIYQLDCEDMINDVAFSPNGKRLYDCRGQFCNVWEPNVLLRDEQAGDTVSESSSVSAVSQARVEQQDHISAIGSHQGAYQAIGTQAGVVSVLDTQASDGIAVKLWEPRSLVKHLDWSSDGKYLACADLSGRVHVHRVKIDDGDWTAVSVFSTYMGSGGIQNILLNDDGSYLFVKNGREVTVFQVETRAGTTHNSSLCASWIRHPRDSSSLLAFTPGQVQIFQWKSLRQIANFTFDYQPMPPDPGVEQTFDLNAVARVNSIVSAATGRELVIDLIIMTGDRESYRTLIVKTPPKAAEIGDRSRTLSCFQIPASIQDQIQTSLGILSNQRFMFIHKEDWVCSFSFSVVSSGLSIVRHYFFPKDWVTTESLQLCTLLPDGRLLMPNNGELAFIKCETVW